MFAVTRGSGFTLTFENGWTASVQFGAGNYASNRDADYFAARKEDFWKSQTAEIAAWSEGRTNWYKFGLEEDEIKGWCTTDEVARFLDIISKLPFSDFIPQSFRKGME